MAMAWTYKRGAVGKVLTGTLQQGDGSAIDLSGMSVVMSAKASDSAEPVISESPVTVVDGPTGAISWAVTVEAAAIPSNLDGYLMEFSTIDGANIDFVPTDDNLETTYGRLIVQEPLVLPS